MPPLTISQSFKGFEPGFLLNKTLFCGVAAMNRKYGQMVKDPIRTALKIGDTGNLAPPNTSSFGAIQQGAGGIAALRTCYAS